MNKLVIPALLTATVLVAGMFAFMPVQKASTVHTTVQASERATVFFSPGIVITGFMAGNTTKVLVDNAGIGGKSDVEVAWRFADTDCKVFSLVGSTFSQVTNDNALDTPLADTSLAHGDVTNAEAIALRATPGACDFAITDFVSVSTIKGTT